MSKTRAEVQELLDRLDDCSADELEGQDVDFKEWGRDDRTALTKAVEWAVCMANGGGGTIVFGVADDLIGRANAVVGVPPSVDVNRLRQAIYDRTDPKLTPVFDELEVPEGTGRIIAMHVHPGMPPYTDTSGKGLIRVGKDCMPLTGTVRKQLLFEMRETDYTGAAVEAVSHARLVSGAEAEEGRKLEWEVAKTRIMNVIRRRASRGEAPLVNSDVRRITGFDRHQVYRLIREFVDEGRIRIDGHGRAAEYIYRGEPEDRQ